MGRPRAFDLETLLDHAKALWAERGTAGVTIRALSARSGASNGAIYHAFGSRERLLARVWIREAVAFLEFQRAVVAAALDSGTARDAVVAAALAPADYADRDPQGSRVLLAVTLDDLAGTDLSAGEQDDLDGLRGSLAELITSLAAGVWGRADRTATGLITSCLVHLPSALLLHEHRPAEHVARHALTLAVRGILAETPPAPVSG